MLRQRQRNPGLIPIYHKIVIDDDKDETANPPPVLLSESVTTTIGGDCKKGPKKGPGEKKLNKKNNDWKKVQKNKPATSPSHGAPRRRNKVGADEEIEDDDRPIEEMLKEKSELNRAIRTAKAREVRRQKQAMEDKEEMLRQKMLREAFHLGPNKVENGVGGKERGFGQEQNEYYDEFDAEKDGLRTFREAYAHPNTREAFTRLLETKKRADFEAALLNSEESITLQGIKDQIDYDLAETTRERQSILIEPTAGHVSSFISPSAGLVSSEINTGAERGATSLPASVPVGILQPDTPIVAPNAEHVGPPGALSTPGHQQGNPSTAPLFTVNSSSSAQEAEALRTQLDLLTDEQQDHLEEKTVLQPIPLRILGHRGYDKESDMVRYGTDTTEGLVDCLTKIVTIQNRGIKDLQKCVADLRSAKAYIDEQMEQMQSLHLEKQGRLVQDLLSGVGLKCSDLKPVHLQKQTGSANLDPIFVDVHDIRDALGNLLIPARTVNLTEYPHLRTHQQMATMVNMAVVQIYGDGDKSVAAKGLENVSLAFKNDVSVWGLNRTDGISKIRSALMKFALRLYADPSDNAQQVLAYEKAKFCIRRAPIEIRRFASVGAEDNRRPKRRRNVRRSLQEDIDRVDAEATGMKVKHRSCSESTEPSCVTTPPESLLKHMRSGSVVVAPRKQSPSASGFNARATPNQTAPFRRSSNSEVDENEFGSPSGPKVPRGYEYHGSVGRSFFSHPNDAE